MLLIGRPVEALRAWLDAAGIKKGAVFREITRWGQLGRTALDPQSVNAILKKRCAQAGLDPKAVLGAWAALGLPDRGGSARGFVAGGDAAVPAPLGAAGIQLLQRDRDRTRRTQPAWGETDLSRAGHWVSAEQERT